MDTTQTIATARSTTTAARTRCEVWTRVMGYHRPLSHFNIGKKAEHMSRKHFKECVIANCEFCQKYEIKWDSKVYAN